VWVSWEDRLGEHRNAVVHGQRYPVEIINHCVWLYFRFPLSFREVEELMLARGVVVGYETIRRWCAKFGPAYANQLRRRRPRPGDKWHLDEVFIRINGKLYLRQVAQGAAVCAACVGDRQAGQLQGRSPRADVVGETPAVAVSQ
jgi:putative transposase